MGAEEESGRFVLLDELVETVSKIGFRLCSTCSPSNGSDTEDNISLVEHTGLLGEAMGRQCSDSEKTRALGGINSVNRSLRWLRCILERARR